MNRHYALILKNDVNANIDAVVKYVLKKFPDAMYIKIPTQHHIYDIAEKRWRDLYEPMPGPIL